MRTWLSILLVLFAVVAAQAGVEKSPAVCVHTASAQLTSGEDNSSRLSEAPLLATSISTISSRLCGSETAPVRVRNLSSVMAAALRSQHYQICNCPGQQFKKRESEYIFSTRAADHYVYALRKIII